MSTYLFCTSGPAGMQHAAEALTTIAGTSFAGTSFARAAGAQASSAQPAGEPAGAPSTEFKPTKGGGNIASGEVLLVEAYAAMWLLALGLVLLTVFKQRKQDERIAQLSSEIERARKQQDAEAS